MVTSKIFTENHFSAFIWTLLYNLLNVNYLYIYLLIGTKSSKCYTFSESSPANVHSEIEEYLFEVVEKFRRGMHLGFPEVRIPM